MGQITIKQRYTDAVLYTHETTDERMASGLAMRDALEAACKSGAYLRGAYLRGADLIGANLIGANLSGADLSRAYLSSANLSDANLSDAYLIGANLSGANLSGADLIGADLSDAYLRGANLSDAYLRGADLIGANLSGANLSGANLSDAYLRGADLRGAKWAEGVFITRHPLQISGMHWPVNILDQHMQIGCQLHSLADWSAFDDSQIAAMDGRDALRFWRANKDALLSLARADGRNFEPVAQAQEVA